MSDLDQDFKKLAVQINAKIKEAAASLKEANELATKAGLPALIFSQMTRDDMHWHNDQEKKPLSNHVLGAKMDELEAKMEDIDVGSLENELGNAGWSVSSSYC